jgi:hypothetical protein
VLVSDGLTEPGSITKPCSETCVSEGTGFETASIAAVVRVKAARGSKQRSTN